jgi:hypothetical protein
VIDYYQSLHPSIAQNSRVLFHQGFFTEVLRDIHVSNTDLVVMSRMGRVHGFSDLHAYLLRACVGKGLLLTDGDNGGIEDQPWFQDQFSKIQQLDYDLDIALWQGR